VLLRVAAKFLMTLFHPESEDLNTDDDDADTGGSGSGIMFTTTAAHVPEGDAVGPTFVPSGSSKIGTAKTTKDMNIIATSDGQFHPISKGTERHVFELVTITDGTYKDSPAYLVQIAGGVEMGLLLASGADYVPVTPTPPPSANCGEAVRSAVAQRDESWTEWLLAGSPGNDT
jgi:hypothetical protein